MKVLPKFTKQLISLIAVATMMLTTLLSGTIYAAAENLDTTLAWADGNAYFYFAAGGLEVQYKNGFSVNDNEIVYITQEIIAHTERIDKTWIKSGELNTITVFIGDEDGVIDESLSHNAVNKACDEFGITASTIRLILPNGCIVMPSKLIAYSPDDTSLPLKDSYIATETVYSTTMSNPAMGDNESTKTYKLDIQFDLTNVDWNPEDDMESVLPDIKDVSLQIGAEPSQRNIVWYSTSDETGIVQLALKTDMTDDEFPTNAKSFSATAHTTGLTGYTSYKSTMTELAENTEYIYRVGNNVDGWSPAYSFKTQNFDGSFSFLAVSDPQLGQGNRFDNIQDEIDGWTTTLNKAKEYFPEGAFLACMGDQVAKTHSESQFDALFVPESLKSFALAAVAGNHDVGSNYAPHFNMPNLTGYGIQTTMGPGSDDYWFTYGDALFMHINGMSKAYDEHIQFMEETIEENPDAKWKFVMTHYGFYGATLQGFTTENIIKLREALAPEFSRLGIDVVLDGHEHCYSRSYLVNATDKKADGTLNELPNKLTGGSAVTDPDPNEVLYLTLNSASGTDYVKPQELDKLPCTAKVVQEYIPNVSKIDITDSSFTINTYRTSDMAIVDTFTINRTQTPAVKSVSVFPKTSNVKTGFSQTYTAEIFGYNNPSQEVVWSVSGNESSKTTINSEGVLSVDIDETAKNLVVTATSAENNTKAASVTVTVESTIIELNVAQGVTYALPTTVNNLSVTKWTNTSGNEVTNVDTSLAGYRFYTAALADGTMAKYRVNVGEYKELMSDDFEDYAESLYREGTTATITGGKFTLGAYSDTDGGAQRLAKDGTNTVAAIGPKRSSLTKLQWAPTDKSIGEAFKVSYKLRVASFDLDTVSSNGDVVFWGNNFKNTNGVQLRATVAVDGDTRSITKSRLLCQSSTGNNYYADLGSYVEWTEADANNVVSMKNYITVEIEGNGVQYSARVNGTEVANNVPWANTDISTGGIGSICWAKRATGEIDTVTYADDMVYSKAIYITNTLKNVPVTATVKHGDTTAQTATVALNMSDGTTKNFTVNYTADTSSVGVKTASGTIAGIDDAVPVTYTVSAATVINEIENNEDSKTQVILNNNFALADGTKLFVAVYDTEPLTMKKIRSVDLNATQRAAGEQTIVLSEDIISAASGAVVKVFVWNGECAPLASELYAGGDTSVSDS